MKTVFSPRDLAVAIGVSESSLKRWIDDGRIAVTRTPGGHRRVPLHAAIQFVRDNGIDVVNPSALGLSDLEKIAEGGPDRDEAEVLYDLLLGGESTAARSFVVSALLEGRSVAEICDGPMREAMKRIGTLWREQDDGIFLEHRATDITLECLRALRLSLKSAEGSPVALGGALENDPYAIPSLMAATVLNAVGYQATNLGPNTPADSLFRAAREVKASIVWLSVSHVEDADRLSEHVNWLSEQLEGIGATFVVGGREIDSLALSNGASKKVFGNSMRDLEDRGRLVLAAL